MASSFKRTYFKPTTTGLDVAYTVPAVSSAILLSAIATTTNGTAKTVSVGVAPTGATEPNWVSRNIPVQSGSSVNLIPERMALNTGDRVVVNADVDLMQLVQTASSMPVVNPKSLAVNTAGTVILIAGDNGVARSVDGGQSFTLTNGNVPVNSGFNLLEFFNSLFIYFASGTSIYASADGITWTLYTGQTFPTSQIAASPTKLMGLNNGSIYESTNGTTWNSSVTRGMATNLKTGAEVNLNAVYYNSSNGAFIAVGDNGVVLTSVSSGNTTAPRSTDWTQMPSGVLDNLNGINSHPSAGTILIVGDRGRYITLQTNFTTVSVLNTLIAPGAENENFKAVAWNTSSTQFILCGTGGIIYTTNTSGGAITARTSGVTVNLNAVATRTNANLVVGDNGTMLSEVGTSGVTWVSVSSGTSEHLYAVAYATALDRYVIVGANGTLLTTTTVFAAATARTSGTSEHLYGVMSTSATSSILITGANGTLLALDNPFSTYTVTPLKSNVTADIYDIISSTTHAIFCGKGGLIGTSTFNFTTSVVPAYHLQNVTLTTTGTNLNSIQVFGSLAVAVGDNGTIYTSSGAFTTWTARTSGTSSNLRGVWKSGSVWVAVGDAGAVTVGDNSGVTWSNQTSISANNLNAVTIGPASTGFIAVGSGGVIFTANAAGTSWTAQTNADTQDLFGVAYNTTNTIFVAVGGNTGTGRVLTGNSTATTWTVQTSGTSDILRSVSWSNSPSEFAAVGDSGRFISGSNLGTTWNTRNSSTTGNLRSVLCGVGGSITGLSYVTPTYIAIGGVNSIFQTSVGVTVNCMNRRLTSTAQINSIASAGTYVLSVGAGGLISGYLVNNSGWQESYVLKPNEISGVGYHNSLGAIACGTGAMVYTGQSTNTTRWNITPHTVNPEVNMKKVFFNSNTVIMVGNNGYMMTQGSLTTSPVSITSVTNTNLRSIGWNGTRHVAVGETGEILYTVATGVSAVDYVRATSGVTDNLNDIFANSSTVTVIVGDNGRILTSTGSAATTWTSQTSGTSEHLYGVVYSSVINGFIAVGANGTILTSNSTATTWTARTSGTTRNLNGIYLGASSTPIAVGDNGTVLFADTSAISWTPLASPTVFNLKAGFFGGSTSGYAVGTGYTILDTTTLSSIAIRSTFTQAFVPTSQNNATINGVDRPIWVGNNGMMVMSAGRSTIAGTTLMIPRFTGTYNNLTDIFVDGNTRIFIAGTGGTVIIAPAAQTYLGISWVASGTTNDLNGISFGGVTVVACGANGTVVYGGTTINTTWSLATTGVTTTLKSLGYVATGTTWYVCGNSGQMITAATETAVGAWTVRTTGTSQDLNSLITPVVFNMIIAVGNAGTIITATAGSPETWTSRTSNTTQDLLDVNFHSSAYMATCGRAGAYVYTSNGTTWTSATSGTTNTIVSISLNNSAHVSYMDASGISYFKSSWAGDPFNIVTPRIEFFQLANTNAVIFAYKTPISTTSYVMYFTPSDKTAVANTRTSTTAVTDITSVGGNSTNVFIISQTTGNAQYATDFTVTISLDVATQSTKLVGNRILLGSLTNVLSIAQSSITAASTVSPVTLGPASLSTLNFDRFSNTAYAMNSNGSLWKIDDITSNSPRGGLQFVVSTTEIV